MIERIPLEKRDQRVADALAQQAQGMPVVLTRDSEAIALAVRLPAGIEGSQVAAEVMASPSGTILVRIDVSAGTCVAASSMHPVSGRCRGLLTEVAADDEHLRDFADYMQ